MRWETKYTCRWPILLVISVPKIFLNGQFYFNLSSKTWSHVFLEYSDIQYCLCDTSLHLFADDTNLFMSGKTVRETVVKANACIEALQTLQSKFSLRHLTVFW